MKYHYLDKKYQKRVILELKVTLAVTEDHVDIKKFDHIMDDVIENAYLKMEEEILNKQYIQEELIEGIYFNYEIGRKTRKPEYKPPRID